MTGVTGRPIRNGLSHCSASASPAIS